MVSDLAKQQSDDTTLTERHIAFLLNKYRSYLLKQKYLNKAQEIPLSNYQTICADMTLVPAMAGCTYEQCMDGDNSPLLRSIEKVDLPLTFSDTKVSLLKCKGKFSLYIDVWNKQFTESQMAFIRGLFTTTDNTDIEYFFPLYGDIDDEEEPRYNEDNVATCSFYVDEDGGAVDYDVVYDKTTKKYTFNLIQDDTQSAKYGIGLQYTHSGEFGDSIYLTDCSEDANTLIEMLDRHGISAKLYTDLSTDVACNETMFYTNAMRQFNGILVVDRERFNYVGHSKYYRSNGYATIGIDNHLYVKSDKDLSAYAAQYNTETGEAGIPTGKALITAIFENPDKAYEHSSCTYKDSEGHTVKCPEAQDGICDPWDREFPIEDALQTQLIALTMRDIYAGSMRPKDTVNNANDDLSSLESYIRSALKRGYYKNVADGDSE